MHKKKIIFLDPQCFYSQKFGGISRLFSEFWVNASKNENVEIICPLIYSENLHLADHNLNPIFFKFLHNKKGKGKQLINAIQKRLNKWYTIFKLKTVDYDVLLSTNYDSYFLKYIGNKPLVVTVFDLIQERFPNYFDFEKKLMENKKLLCKKSNKIVAISHSTKRDLLEYYDKINELKVDVIHLSQSIDTSKNIHLKWLPKKYVLFVGKRELYKQFNTVLQAMVEIFKTDQDVFLVCAGGGDFTSKEIKNLIDLKVDHRVIQQNFFDNELHSIYNKAEMFIFPSEYEGFGIPTLEAMMSNCAVILSNSSSLPEIGEDAALYFEPNDVEDLVLKIKTILENSNVKQCLQQKGKLQAQKFSWEKMTNQYLQTINSIID